MTKGSADLMANSPSQGTARLQLSTYQQSSEAMNTSNNNLQYSGGALRVQNGRDSSPGSKMAITFAQMKDYKRRGTFYQSEVMHVKSNKSVGKEATKAPGADQH